MSSADLQDASPGGASTTDVSAPRLHFADLDFLRGIAAFCVLIFHFSDHVGVPGWLPHGYFAVDLFFVLSGFVLAHAYGQQLRLRTIGPFAFIWLRVLRFLPMVVLGSSIGLAVACRGSDAVGLSAGQFLSEFLRSCALIPILGPQGLQALFPLDGPLWSLFFELVANVVFAGLMLTRRPTTWACALLIVSATGLIFGITREGSLHYAGVDAQHFALGFPRVGFSFCIGLLLHRFQALHKIASPGRWGLALLFILVCLMPTLPGEWDVVFDLISLAFILPAIVAIGACGRSPGPGQRLAKWLGLMSFPLYAIHYPLIRVLGLVLRHHVHVLPERLAAMTACSLVLVGIACLVEVAFDAPLRRLFRRRATRTRPVGRSMAPDRLRQRA